MVWVGGASEWNVIAVGTWLSYVVHSIVDNVSFKDTCPESTPHLCDWEDLVTETRETLRTMVDRSIEWRLEMRGGIGAVTSEVY